MTARAAIDALQTGVKLVEELTSLLGSTRDVTNIAAGLANIGQQALTAYGTLSTEDTLVLSDLTVTLQACADGRG